MLAAVANATDPSSLSSALLPPGFDDAAYLRVASMAIGGYELICTLPAEYRFYRQQYMRRSLSQQCVLFILIRYLSIAVVIVSNVGFFKSFPSLEACRHFMLAAPVLKALQTLASQLILSTRTYTISRKSTRVLGAMIVTLAFSVPVEFFSNIYRRMPVHNPITHNCTSGNASSHRIAWINYLAAMLFDLVAICISSGYLWVYSATTTRVSHFVQILLYEGLGYFVVLTALNIFNLILYLHESEATQSTGASLGYVIIFIMSQRILIRQRQYADKYAASALGSQSHSVSISRRLDTTHEINAALRSQFEDCSFKSKSRSARLSSDVDVELGESSFGSKASGSASSRTRGKEVQSGGERESRMGRRMEILDETCATRDRERGDDNAHTPPNSQPGSGDAEFDVQVRIERSVTVEHVVLNGRENYKKPRVMW